MLTIKDLAEEIGVSKVAINKKVEHLGIKDQLTKAGNRYLLSDEQADLIRGAFKYRTEMDTPTTDQGDTKQDEMTTEALLKVIDTLTEQLAEKDKQLNRLYDLLSERERSFQQSHYLLADKGGILPGDNPSQEVESVSIEDDTDQEPTTEQVENKSFFGWLFGKR